MKHLALCLGLFCVILSPASAQESTLPSIRMNNGKIVAKPVVDPQSLPLQREKLDIVLPDVRLKDVPLRQAIIELRSMVHAADKNPDEKRRGVNVVIKLDATDPRWERKITLDLAKPTLKQTFLEVARQSDCQLMIEPFFVGFVPPTYQVPAGQLVGES